MARHLRLEYPGAIYHVTCRTIGDWRSEKLFLFRDDSDRSRFIDRLGERVERFRIRLYLFVCMTNHIHLVFETPEANCSKFMQSLSTAYTVYYNRRYGRHGHLLDGRFKAKLVDGDDYLLALSRYVHLNPVCVGSMRDNPIELRIRALRAYLWSSYPSYIGKRKSLAFVDYAPVLGGMSGKPEASRKLYREYVEEGLAKTDDDLLQVIKCSPRSIGGAAFRIWVDGKHQERVTAYGRTEDVSFRRVTEPLPAGDILAVLSEVFQVDVEEFKRRRRCSPLRAVASRFLLRYAGLDQRAAAGLLGVESGSAICNQLRRLSELQKTDRRLRRKVDEADRNLRSIFSHQAKGQRIGHGSTQRRNLAKCIKKG